MQPLEALQVDLSAPADRFNDPSLYPRLFVLGVAELLHVDFYGAPFEEAFDKLCERLVLPEVAPRLASVVLRAPDEGHNGTCNWDLTVLVEAEGGFPALKYFAIEQNGPDQHNRRIVAEEYEESGAIGRLLRKAPVLDALVVPSAPDRSFFGVTGHPLRYLSVDAGYDTQGFVRELASSRSLPGLRALEFGEYSETYMDDFAARCTPLGDYELLFKSPVFRALNSFTLRNPVLSSQELSHLRSLAPRKDLQFKVVRCGSEYVKA